MLYETKSMPKQQGKLKWLVYIPYGAHWGMCKFVLVVSYEHFFSLKYLFLSLAQRTAML